MADNEQASKTAKTSEFQSLLDSNSNRPEQSASLQKEIPSENITNAGMTKDEVVSVYLFHSQLLIQLFNQFSTLQWQDVIFPAHIHFSLFKATNFYLELPFIIQFLYFICNLRHFLSPSSTPRLIINFYQGQRS